MKKQNQKASKHKNRKKLEELENVYLEQMSPLRFCPVNENKKKCF